MRDMNAIRSRLPMTRVDLAASLTVHALLIVAVALPRQWMDEPRALPSPPRLLWVSLESGPAGEGDAAAAGLAPARSEGERPTPRPAPPPRAVPAAPAVPGPRVSAPAPVLPRAASPRGDPATTAVREWPSAIPERAVSAPPVAAAARVAAPVSAQAGSPASAAVAAGRPAWPGPGEVDRAARPRWPIRPDYPALARQRGRESTVVVEAWVDEQGEVSFSSVARSGGADFDASARRAVEGSAFRPARLDGRDVASRVALRIHFQLYD